MKNFGASLEKILSKVGLTLTAEKPTFRLYRQNFKLDIFMKNSLIHDESDGYWKLNKMPTDSELHEYYSQEYWIHRGDQNLPVNMRDISHFLDLSYFCPEFFQGVESKRILNFGAGHGGLSHLLFGLGFDVTNLDPSPPQADYGNKWKSLDSLEKIKGLNFDLIYASHALEHVTDIRELLRKFSEMSNEKTIFMFEVPDSMCPGHGGSDGAIHPPHTYYYTHSFYKKYWAEVKFLTSIKSSEIFLSLGKLEKNRLEEGQGNSIRFIGKSLQI